VYYGAAVRGKDDSAVVEKARAVAQHHRRLL